MPPSEPKPDRGVKRGTEAEEKQILAGRLASGPGGTSASPSTPSGARQPQQGEPLPHGALPAAIP